MSTELKTTLLPSPVPLYSSNKCSENQANQNLTMFLPSLGM